MRLKACGRQTVTVTCTGTGCKDITLINSIIPCVEGDEGSTDTIASWETAPRGV
jgi:hypothetical protein